MYPMQRSHYHDITPDTYLDELQNARDIPCRVNNHSLTCEGVCYHINEVRHLSGKSEHLLLLRKSNTKR